MNKNAKLPRTFWIIAGAALIWNLMGLYAYYIDMTISAETLSAMEQGQQEYYANFPVWKKVAYGAATIFGFLGSLGLILRKFWSPHLFLISLLGLIIQGFHNVFMTNAIELMGIGAGIFQGVLVLIGLGLYFYSRNASSKGWLA